MTSTYGALAGALVGAASLAFSEDPANHMSNISKGASIGLYAGILLGAYINFWSKDSSSAEPMPTDEELMYEDDYGFRPYLQPLIKEQSIAGAELGFTFSF